MKYFQINLLNSLASETFQTHDDLFKVVAFIFPDDRKLIEAAFDVLDSLQYISKFSNSNLTRDFWIVPGSRGQDYLCLSRYCSCRSFLDLSKQSNPSSPILCKHLLAVKLAHCCGMMRVKILSEVEFVKLMTKEYPSV